MKIPRYSGEEWYVYGAAGRIEAFSFTISSTISSPKYTHSFDDHMRLGQHDILWLPAESMFFECLDYRAYLRQRSNRHNGGQVDLQAALLVSFGTALLVVKGQAVLYSTPV